MAEDYENMTIAQLDRRVRAGDPKAIETKARTDAELAGVIEPLIRFAQNPLQGLDLYGPRPDLDGLMEQMGREKAANERAAVEREEAMLHEVAAMRRAVEGAEGRSRAAEQRADLAEARERRGERRQRVLLALAVGSLIGTLVSTAVAAVTVFG